MASQQEIERILNGDVRLLVTQAESLGKQLAADLKASQLRNIYGLVRQAQMEWQRNHRANAYNSLILLQPKLAYFDKRTEARGARPMRPLKDALDHAIGVLRNDKGPNETHFKNFVDFCEAIVAYHKANRRDRD
jgi:CRISPR type III-A-associated protein Csm2